MVENMFYFPSLELCSILTFRMSASIVLKCLFQFVNYLQTGAIMIQVYGKQKMPKTKKTVNTKDALQKESLAKGMLAAANTNTKVGHFLLYLTMKSDNWIKVNKEAYHRL